MEAHRGKDAEEILNMIALTEDIRESINSVKHLSDYFKAGLEELCETMEDIDALITGIKEKFSSLEENGRRLYKNRSPGH